MTKVMAPACPTTTAPCREPVLYDTDFIATATDKIHRTVDVSLVIHFFPQLMHRVN